MLKPLSELIKSYNLKIRGIVHIGGHRGQEYKSYKDNNIQNLIFVEPHPHNFQIMKNNVGPECALFETALGNQVGTVEMYVEEANEGQSSSILEPVNVLTQYPNIEFLYLIDIPITKLDLLEFDRKNFNFINIDVQGFELEVFKGGVKTLQSVDYVYSEVNRDELYKNCAKVEQLDDFLGHYGFSRVGTWWEGGTWGDSLFIK